MYCTHCQRYLPVCNTVDGVKSKLHEDCFYELAEKFEVRYQKNLDVYRRLDEIGRVS